MVKVATGLLISYLVGSIPFAYIFVRIIKDQDIRQFGSGNVGATNALRLLGKPLGLTILFLDALKGFIPVFLFADIFYPSQWYMVVVGICCVIGHVWPVFLKFKGGKGVATSLGVLIGLGVVIPVFRLPLALSFGVWLIIFGFFKYVSLASIISAGVLPIFLIFFKAPFKLVFVITGLSLLVIIKHKSNIIRLLQKTESKTKIK